jgi:hypothetical protein
MFLSSEKLATVHLRGRPFLPIQLQKQLVPLLYSFEMKVLWVKTSGDAFHLVIINGLKHPFNQDK